MEKIRKEHTGGFIKSCLKNSFSQEENAKQYIIFLPFKQENGNWSIDSEDLNKVFSGTWINSEKESQ